MFNLTRYFSTLSFILIVLAGGILGSVYQRYAIRQLIEQQERDNVEMTHMFRNLLWTDFAHLVSDSGPGDAAALRDEGARLGLRGKASALMRDTAVVKLKIYRRDGLTVFSTDPRQIGEDKRDNAGFRSALAGKVVSELTYRDQFDAFEGERHGINVISSYIPVRIGNDVAAVFELYHDVTPMVAEIDRVRLTVAAVILGVLTVLYLLQLGVVRRAHRILRHQEERLADINRELDDRVHERTAELEEANRNLRDEMEERRRIEQRLDHLAHHDPLTGLPNRLRFQEQLRRGIGLASRGGRQIGLLFLDLDRFKDVNDTQGHSTGDELLIQVTQRLAASLRVGDTLARLGGDEFVCMLEDLRDAHEAQTVADKLVALIEAPFTVQEHELFLSVSIGISLFPADGDDGATLLRNADTAMYQAKAHGRGRSHFYAAEMTIYAQERIRMERLLRHAIAAGELEVHYQLKVAAGDGRPAGAEALARWRSAELGLVSPVRFIPLAEDTGFIVELGAWVLNEACRQMAAWRAAGMAVPKVSVNLSVKQLERADVVEQVRTALGTHGLDASSLELEVTESIIMAVGDAIGILDRLRALGVQISVDDFGTGYSSLSYLKLLPIQTLKIDRAFVLGIGRNQGDEAIIRAILALARSLGLATVAEGVEAEHQAEFLRALGCDQIQGYLYGKPQVAGEFAAEWQRAACRP